MYKVYFLILNIKNIFYKIDLYIYKEIVNNNINKN